MWGSRKQAEKDADKEGYPALTSAREGCLHGFPEQKKHRDVLRNDTENRQAKLQLKRPPTLVISNCIPGITKICKLH